MAVRSSRSKKLAQGNDLNGILFAPESDWRPVADFPDIRGAKRIAVDTEGRDPNLKARGPGSIRGDGYLTGVSVCTDDGFSGYYPFAHLAGGNLPKEQVIQWLQDMLGDPRADKIFCGAIFDLEWLHASGVTVRGRIHDISAAESLIDEERFEGYGLDAISEKYLGAGKDESLLRRAAADYNVDPKSEMWKLHSRYVGPYATADAVKTLKSWEVQQLEIDRQGLRKIYELECELIPIILQMRIRGVRVDLEAARKLSKEWETKENELKYDVLMKYGRDVDPWSGIELRQMCDKMGIPFPRTDKGNASFTADFLEHSGHPFLKAIRDIRRYNRMRGTFVDELIFGNQINGRIHAQFHALRGDEYGVRGGRFSSSNPNLQQVPARDEELAPLIRGLFIPEDGCDWAKLDYSQQEPRITVHYAYICKLEGAERARQMWLDDPKKDFYKFVAEIAKLVRKDAKTVYLGRTYGMGKRKLAMDLGRSEDEAEGIISQFDEESPYLQKLSDKCIKQADARGYIRTIYGRVCHFDFWIPADARFGDETVPVKSLAKAQALWPDKRLIRAFTRKALNRLIQGSAGDMTKLGMVHNYREHKAVPNLQVHDELDYAACPDIEYAKKLQHGMEVCCPLTVPVVAELDYGRCWK